MSATGLLDLSRALHRARSLQEVMDEVRRACKQHTRYDRVYILLPALDRRSLEIVGYVAPNMDRVHRQVAAIELDKDPFMLKILALKEPVVIPDRRLDPLADQKQVEIFGNRTAIAIPMFDDDGLIGPFNVATFGDQGVLLPTPRGARLLRAGRLARRCGDHTATHSAGEGGAREAAHLHSAARCAGAPRR